MLITFLFSSLFYPSILNANTTNDFAKDVPFYLPHLVDGKSLLFVVSLKHKQLTQHLEIQHKFEKITLLCKFIQIMIVVYFTLMLPILSNHIKFISTC